MEFFKKQGPSANVDLEFFRKYIFYWIVNKRRLKQKTFFLGIFDLLRSPLKRIFDHFLKKGAKKSPDAFEG